MRTSSSAIDAQANSVHGWDSGLSNIFRLAAMPGAAPQTMKMAAFLVFWHRSDH